jgi:hypothetical protein
MNPRIHQVTAGNDYRLTLVFANGEERIFDMRPYLEYPVFRPLQHPDFFKLARADHGTAVWPNEIDFDPDALYLESSPVRSQRVA